MQKVSERGLASGRLATSGPLPGWQCHAAGRLDRAAVPPGRCHVSWGTSESNCFPSILHRARRPGTQAGDTGVHHRPPARCSRSQRPRPRLHISAPYLPTPHLGSGPAACGALWGVVAGTGTWASAALSDLSVHTKATGVQGPECCRDKGVTGQGRQGRLWARMGMRCAGRAGGSARQGLYGGPETAQRSGDGPGGRGSGAEV